MKKLQNLKLKSPLVALTLLIQARLFGQNNLPTITTNEVETQVRNIGSVAVLAVSVLGFVFIAVRLFQAVQAVQKGDREGTDRAWMWGAGLVLYIIGAAILNTVMSSWGA